MSKTIALQIAKANSQGIPGKNVMSILDRPMMVYPLIAARASDHIDEIFLSTDGDKVAQHGREYGAEIIDRPSELAQPDSLTQDVLIHALEEIRSNHGIDPDQIVLLFGNSPMIPPGSLDEAIEKLDSDSELDSVFSVGKFNMFSPLRARRVSDEGKIKSYVPINEIEGKGTSSIREKNETTYFANLTVQVFRTECIENIWEGIPPMQWMGQESYAMIQEPAFDVDAEWQIPVVEWWLESNGFTEETTPYDTEE